MAIVIKVFGIPRPGGGKIGGFNHKTGKGFVRPDNPRTAPWRADVVQAAVAQYDGPLLEGPIKMDYLFLFPRPKNHFRSGKFSDHLKNTAPKYHTQKPDLTKVIRSTEDALTGIVWHDDALVCVRSEEKRYCNGDEKPGVYMRIEALGVCLAWTPESTLEFGKQIHKVAQQKLTKLMPYGVSPTFDALPTIVPMNPLSETKLPWLD